MMCCPVRKLQLRNELDGCYQADSSLEPVPGSMHGCRAERRKALACQAVGLGTDVQLMLILLLFRGLRHPCHGLCHGPDHTPSGLAFVAKLGSYVTSLSEAHGAGRLEHPPVVPAPGSLLFVVGFAKSVLVKNVHVLAVLRCMTPRYLSDPGACGAASLGAQLQTLRSGYAAHAPWLLTLRLVRHASPRCTTRMGLAALERIRWGQRLGPQAAPESATCQTAINPKSCTQSLKIKCPAMLCLGPTCLRSFWRAFFSLLSSAARCWACCADSAASCSSRSSFPAAASASASVLAGVVSLAGSALGSPLCAQEVSVHT